ncbi:MAG: cobalt transporter CbiM [Planctomycetes bacterium]|nr:cobalt transporter CbiM [Planctomycetota bacterium]
MMLFAVHISDGVLAWPWLAAGFALAALFLWISVWRLREEEVPRIALLTAAFFVSSLIHIKAPPTSIHLLLTGLVGVVLGPRAALAIFVGLLLQVLLMQHGGYLTLGVNTCVMSVPALLAYFFFQALHRLDALRAPFGRGLLVGVGAFIWFLCGVYSLTLVSNASLRSLEASAIELANARLLNPWFLLSALTFAIGAILIERRLENTPEFPLGFLIGLLSVLGTAGLNCVVLIQGGERHWPIAPLVLVIAHMPFAVIEGVILGFAVGFLARVKPEMLGIMVAPANPSMPRSPEASG